MFVYQNKDGQICVTFADNKPVENPEFVIAIDKEAKALYAVVGEVAPLPADVVEEEEDEVVEDETQATDEPEVPADDDEDETV